MKTMAAAKRVERSYGLYRIIGAVRGREAQAAVYAGLRQVLLTTGSDLEAAVELAVAQLEARKAARRSAREQNIATADELRDLLDALQPAWNAKIRRLLDIHARSPRGEATAKALGQIAGKDCGQVWWEYCRFGRKIASALDGGIPKSVEAAMFDVRPVLAFAELVRPTPSDDWVICLRPQIIDALGAAPARLRLTA